MQRVAYTVEEVAKRSGLCQHTIRAEIKRGNLEACRFGNRFRILAEAESEWLRSKLEPKAAA